MSRISPFDPDPFGSALASCYLFLLQRNRERRAAQQGKGVGDNPAGEPDEGAPTASEGMVTELKASGPDSKAA